MVGGDSLGDFSVILLFQLLAWAVKIQQQWLSFLLAKLM